MSKLHHYGRSQIMSATKGGRGMGVWQMLTFADKGGMRGGLTNADGTHKNVLKRPHTFFY